MTKTLPHIWQDTDHQRHELRFGSTLYGEVSPGDDGQWTAVADLHHGRPYAATTSCPTVEAAKAWVEASFEGILARLRA